MCWQLQHPFLVVNVYMWARVSVIPLTSLVCIYIHVRAGEFSHSFLAHIHLHEYSVRFYTCMHKTPLAHPPTHLLSLGPFNPMKSLMHEKKPPENRPWTIQFEPCGQIGTKPQIRLLLEASCAF